jgi:hypothetical protein
MDRASGVKGFGGRDAAGAALSYHMFGTAGQIWRPPLLIGS